VNQQFYKNMALWVVILVVMLLLVTMLKQDEVAPPDIAYSDFMSNVEERHVESVTIEEGHIRGVMTSGEKFTTYAPVITDDLLAKRRVRF